jgi:hypothetical protein
MDSWPRTPGSFYALLFCTHLRIDPKCGRLYLKVNPYLQDVLLAALYAFATT